MIKHLTAAIAATTLMAGAANAAPISFADVAAGNEGGIANLTEADVGTGGIIFYQSGFNLQLNGGVGGLDFFPYFDDIDGDGQPAGLGVCRELDGDAGTTGPGAECAASGDDSIDGDFGLNEFIALGFGTVGGFDLQGISFRDGNHNLINDSDGLVRVVWRELGGVVQGLDLTFAEVVAMAAAGEFGLVDILAFGYLNTEFYIESISDVPLPGALPLLISGIAGLGFASRKKKKAA